MDYSKAFTEDIEKKFCEQFLVFALETVKIVIFVKLKIVLILYNFASH